MTEQVTQALNWLTALLARQQLPYQIVGGLAAHLYGGSRPVADIDLYIPAAKAQALLAEVDAFISKPLRHYREAQWDLEYLQLIYQGQKIEIGLAPGTTIYCQQRQQWLPLAIDFAKSVTVSYQGMLLPVMPITSLITYKKWLAREVDIIDIQELNAIALTKNG